jgi:hypothetical protein
MYEEYGTGFARHKGGVSESVAEYLWENQLIALHWGNIPSADPDEYESGENEIEYLNTFAEEGRIVGASYRRINTAEMLVGAVHPGTQISLLYFDDGEFVKEKEIEPRSSLSAEEDEEYRIYKALQLDDVQTVSRDNHPVIFDNSIRPPSASIINWWNVEEHLRRIINEQAQKRSVHSLRSDEVEVLCEEYLRTLNPNYRTVRTVGGQVADVDISGVIGDRRVWAEVTMGSQSDVESKIETLSEYTTDTADVLIFGPRNSKPSTIPNEITYFPVETVFDALDFNDTGRQMIDEMLNVES